MSTLPTVRTPFLSTRRKNIHKEQLLSRSANKAIRNSDTDELAFKDLIKKTWHTYTCSPMYCFKSDKVSLKLYSRLLSAVMVANFHQKMGVGTEEEAGTKVIFSLAAGIAVNENEPEAIKISVFTKEGKLISEMYLCSVNAGVLLESVTDVATATLPGMKTTINEKFTTFPLLLCKGTMISRRIIFDWLKSKFDCFTNRLEFNSYSLAWMLGLWAALHPNEENRSRTGIVWRIPVHGTEFDKIETEFEPESVEVLWKAAHDISSEVVELEEVEKFIGAIEEHLTQHFKIKFKALPLHQLHLEIGHLHAEGKIKILSKDHIHSILTHLTCLAGERIQWRRGNCPED